MHHTINEAPNGNVKKYLWEKQHQENLTGTEKSYKPNKITKSSQYKKYESWKN